MFIYKKKPTGTFPGFIHTMKVGVASDAETLTNFDDQDLTKKSLAMI